MTLIQEKDTKKKNLKFGKGMGKDGGKITNTYKYDQTNTSSLIHNT